MLQNDPSNFASSGVNDVLRAHLLRVYRLVALGLMFSGVMGYVVAKTPLLAAFYTPHGHMTGLGILCTIGTFASLIAAMFLKRMNTRALAKLHACYWVFTGTMGVSLSLLFADSSLDLVSPLLATAVAFSGLSLYGYTTSRDLTGLGSFALVGLFGLVGLGIIALLTGFALPSILTSLAGILIFSIFTAYDTQKMKTRFLETGDDSAGAAIMEAISLYLDAINMFLDFADLFNSKGK